MLKIRKLDICIQDKKIVSNINLNVNLGEIHALMGPNGSGKTSFALGLMGHPNYRVTRGSIFLDNKNILSLTPEKRAKLGLFVSYQTPPAFDGVSLGRYLFEAKKGLAGKKNIDIENFYSKLAMEIENLKLPESFLERPLNSEASGGERKKTEILSLINLKPKYVILDEIDTGLDIDALKLVAKEIKKVSKTCGVIIITHYQRILKYVSPDFVHIMKKGRIVATGDYNLTDTVERRGYAVFN